MNKVLSRSYPFTVANGTQGNTVTFTPQAGRVIGCCIYHNNTSGAINSGVVSAKLAKTTGEEVVPLVDIRHFRNREAAFKDGLLPLDLDTENQSFDLTIAASSAFTAQFVGTLVLQYENYDNC